MSVRRHVFPVTVAVKSPFIFADVNASGIGVDTPALRNAKKQPLLPADHFKGLLRQAFAALPAAATGTFTVADLFGPPKDKMRPYEPVRGSLHFADLVCENADTSNDITRIKIDDTTGTVEDGMLQMVELARPLGQTAEFKGSVIWHGTQAMAQDLQVVLQKALRVIPYFGGLRSVGFGRHLRDQSTVGPPVAEGLDGEIVAAPGKSYRVTARFDRPIAVNVKQLSHNIFQGSPVVPGSAIKGALAEMLKAGGVAQTPAVADALSAMRIGHAYAVGQDGKLLDRALPLSWCWYGLADRGAGEFRNELGRPKSEQGFHQETTSFGDFLPDMKGEIYGKLAKHLGRETSDFKTWSLGHTEINHSTGAAEDGQLFVVMALDTQSLAYSFTISLPDDGKDYSPILRRLEMGLDRIGKTEARLVAVQIDEMPKDELKLASPFNIMLETPALFIIPKEGDDPMPADQRLRQYFSHFGLTLEDHFCQRFLVGGYPVLRTKGMKSYRPFALYAAGSCFRLSGSSVDVENFARAASFGLPVLRESGQGGLTVETDYSRCLYLPENGYGEISFDPDFLKDSP